MPLDEQNRIDFELTPVIRNKEFESSEIKDKLESDEINLALLLASTKVELILAETVKMVVNLTDEQFEQVSFDRWSLGTYIENVKNLNRLSEAEIKEYQLRKLVTKRNKLAHDDGYATTLEEDQEEIDEVAEIVEKAVEFVDAVIIDDRRTDIIHSD